MIKTKLLFLLVLWLITSIWSTNAYMLWLKSADNTIRNIQTIEKEHKVRIPLIGFIFDPRGPHITKTINQLSWTLWTTRIYHITLSPNSFSAKEVTENKFDKQYIEFFKAVKNNNLKVVFRTMHEMNWWWYPRASDPENFKKARIHVRNLSREVGLSTNNILFDFSVNHRDMPTKQKPSQTAKLIQCKISQKEKLWCYTFEDYYPWDKYVDLIWFTFYNRWKGNSDRQRLTPEQIVYEKWWNPLERIKKFNKPIIIDEVATTAVWYDWKFDYKKSKEVYEKEDKLKNTRLWQLQQLLRKEQTIVWAVYFNVDYTKWLTKKLIWEADRAVINNENKKVYNTIFTLLKNSDNLHLWSPLLNFFDVWLIKINWIEKFVPLKYSKKIYSIQKSFEKLWLSGNQQKEIIKNANLYKLFPNISTGEIETIKEILK